MEKRIQIKINGLVHGVNFRNFIKQRALELNINGRVKNTADGKVEIIAEGEEAELKKLLMQAQAGPSQARVEEVKYEWHDSKHEFSDFKILFS